MPESRRSQTGQPAILCQVAELQAAGLVATTWLLSQWAEVVAECTVRAGASALRSAQGREEDQPAAARAMESYRTYLRRTARLPLAYGLQFYSALERIRRPEEA
jgi:hypothetical protein